MTRPERALILGAGQGSRLLPMTQQLPKCLLDLSGRSMLEWQLRGLFECGVQEAVVVTGFREDLVCEALTRITPRGMVVRTLFNPFYKLADNLASCWMARAEFDRPCLILNGDTLFEPEIARRLLSAPPAPITVTIDRKPQFDDDDMKVQTKDGRLCAIGKTLPADIVDGESIGFLRFDVEGGAMFVQELERNMRTPEGPGLWYLSAIHRLAQAGAHIGVASIEGLEWGELDFPADLAYVRELAGGWQGGNGRNAAQPQPTSVQTA
ncbi:phosphocholine cytidylyltransferase family protein [Xylophilus sp. GOD-11R]|uniref:phosphocholine cytidylyltransferase family protein n=1 Tax=Xylophilus sp. GOD-11R TaxID=3089814 RepID=UPI00298C87B7|nr:phosphocholine cytidylyltransferase family protein [Xylophilus sp. GOD-11R]WPB58960.1 phosphocholine cytidylyltransferase family protein [Xylophilus sp. GOD-11R]